MTQPRPTAANPVTNQELARAVELAYEWGHLKRLPRTGWLRAGVGRRYLHAASNEEITAEQTATLPHALKVAAPVADPREASFVLTG
jgi:hypothetical protein